MRLLKLLLFVAVLTISGVAAIKAQTTDQAHIQIPVIIRAEQGMEELRDRFVTFYQSNLTEANIGYFERQRDAYIAINASRYYGYKEGGEYIDISVWNYPLHVKSPILSGQNAFRVEIPADDSDMYLEIASDLATALSLYTLGRCEGTHELLNQITDINTLDQNWWETQEFSIHYLKGNCAIIQEDYSAAISLFEQALLRRGADLPVGLVTNLAWTYLQIGEKDKALEIMDELVSTVEFEKLGGGLPHYLSAVGSHAEIYALASEYDIALADMNEFLDLAPQIAAPYVQRGRYYRNIYEWDKSLADFNTALEIEPYYDEAYFQRGVLYYSILQTGQELREEALADFRHYLELAPDGLYAEQATDYAQTIEAELAALNE